MCYFFCIVVSNTYPPYKKRIECNIILINRKTLIFILILNSTCSRLIHKHPTDPSIPNAPRNPIMHQEYDSDHPMSWSEGRLVNFSIPPPYASGENLK